MPIDPTKYGRVTLEDQRNLEDDENVFILAGHDQLAVPTLLHYRDLCKEAGAPQRHLDNITRGIEAMLTWQRDHGSHIPQSIGLLR